MKKVALPKVKPSGVWSTQPFRRCQTQETIACDVFSFARLTYLESCGDFCPV